MRTKTLQSIAVTLGLGVCTVAQAQSPYTSPSKWSNFRTIADTVETVPAPASELPPPAIQHSAPEASTAIGTGCAPCQNGAYASPYSQAMSAPWSGSTEQTRPDLNPWFGSANLLFMTRENDRGRMIATGTIGIVRSNIVDPDSSVGFDIGVGRYFGCGKYGLGINYMNWDPDTETRIINTDPAGNPLVPGDIRAEIIGYNDVLVDADGGGANPAESVYDVINGAGAYGATGMRLTRDMSFQGIEASLFSFGLMGAQRAAYAGCNSGSRFCADTGCGGAAGPMVRTCSGKLRVMTGHGFRWFQLKDEFQAAYNIDGGGYGADDMYDDVEVENNLFGYQFSSMLNYCLTSRMNMNIGGKFGIYGNRVDYSHRLGTENNLAYFTDPNVDGIDVESSDTVLAGLGELDMGLGFRINNCWSVRGGYRMMAVCGVADAVDSMQNTDYNDIALVDDFDADACVILHGGYVGLTFNW